MIRILRPGDEALLEAFLLPLTDSSMFLRANARTGGLDDRGLALQATYAARLGASGQVEAVAAHCWNGMLLIQAPDDPGGVARAALKASGRPLQGISGPYAQVLETGRALGLKASRHALKEGLYTLELAQLVPPPPLQFLSVRRTRDTDLPLCARWRADYLRETGLAAPDDPDVGEKARQGVALFHDQGGSFLLENGKQELLAYSGFNAQLPGTVQIGGVWTPPALRGRGYARCAVAGSLLVAQPERAVLFTPETNAPAIRAYESLGFRRVGEYGLLFTGL